MKSNLPASLIVNACVTPINFATVIPFISFGHFILDKEKPDLNNLMEDLKNNLELTLQTYFKSLLCGIIGWVILCPILIYTLNALIYRIAITFKK